MKALLRHQSNGRRNHVTSLVISDVESAGGLKHASDSSVEHLSIPLPGGMKGMERRLEHERRIMEALASHDIEMVVLSGYMRILTPIIRLQLERQTGKYPPLASARIPRRTRSERRY